MDGWRSVVEMKSPFLLDGMTRPAVLAFCIEDIDFIASIKEGGADLAGGKELIKAIQVVLLSRSGSTLEKLLFIVFLWKSLLVCLDI